MYQQGNSVHGVIVTRHILAVLLPQKKIKLCTIMSYQGTNDILQWFKGEHFMKIYQQLSEQSGQQKERMNNGEKIYDKSVNYVEHYIWWLLPQASNAAVNLTRLQNYDNKIQNNCKNKIPFFWSCLAFASTSFALRLLSVMWIVRKFAIASHLLQHSKVCCRQ